ncbi:MAG: hypothetical protein DKT66_06930 [Candidatus Melainabacteria bacterium]|nr:MAG: hypothetical protein DKT66_06930 [Candidatus Melainabacteria bacterium]
MKRVSSIKEPIGAPMFPKRQKNEKTLLNHSPQSQVRGRLLDCREYTPDAAIAANKNTSQIALRWYFYYCLTARCIRAQYFITLQSVLHVVRASCYCFRSTPIYCFRKAPRLKALNT